MADRQHFPRNGYPVRGVQIGQVWRDRDSRMNGRRVRVVACGNDQVFYRQVVGLDDTEIGRAFRSRRDRFQTAFDLLRLP